MKSSQFSVSIYTQSQHYEAVRETTRNRSVGQTEDARWTKQKLLGGPKQSPLATFSIVGTALEALRMFSNPSPRCPMKSINMESTEMESTQMEKTECALVAYSFWYNEKFHNGII